MLMAKVFFGPRDGDLVLHGLEPRAGELRFVVVDAHRERPMVYVYTYVDFGEGPAWCHYETLRSDLTPANLLPLETTEASRRLKK